MTTIDNSFMSLFITRSHFPLIFRVVCESLGVHCRLIITKLDLTFFLGQRHWYFLSTFKLLPRQKIKSAFSAACEAASQFKGCFSFPFSPKCTIVSMRLPSSQVWHFRPVLCLLRAVFSVTSKDLRYWALQLLHTSIYMFPWISDNFKGAMPLRIWRPSQFWETTCFTKPRETNSAIAMWVYVGSEKVIIIISSKKTWLVINKQTNIPAKTKSFTMGVLNPFLSCVQTPFGPR